MASTTATKLAEEALGNPAGESPKPFGPTPGKPAAGPAETAAKPKEELSKAVSEVIAAKPAGPVVKPASVVAKAAAGDMSGAVKGAKETKITIGGAPEAEPEPKTGKASTLVGGSTAAAAKAKAAAPAVAAASPASAAAIIPEKGPAPLTAMGRQAATGSVMSSGPGAKAEPAGPKAKAKAKAATAPAAKASAAPSTPAGTAPAAGKVPTAPAAAGTAGKAPTAPAAPAPAAAAAAAPVAAPVAASAAPAAARVATPAVAAAPAASGPAPPAPAAVLEIVRGTPQPALESSTNLPSSATVGAKGPSGPAKAYAAAAAPAMTGPVSVPKEMKEGPAAVAVGRAVAAGAETPVFKKEGKPRAPIGKRYQVAFVTSEVAPFSKTGGLGEAMDGLPTALAALGHRVMVISPRYDQYKDAWDTSFWSSVTMGGKEEKVHFFHTYKQKVDYVFVDHPTFMERVNGLSGAKLYGPEWGKDFADNQARFAYFCKAALVAIQDLPLGGYVYGHQTMVVANDWHSGLVPMFIHAQRTANPEMWKETKTALLCHNAVFQGRFQYEEGLAEVFDVPQEYIDSITFNMPLKVGKYNKKQRCVNTMAAGLRYADRSLTVSPSYAKECATDPEKGVELEELFGLGRVTGILNGVKEGVSPAEKNFTTKTKMVCGTFTEKTCVAAKEQLKAAYRLESGLPESEGPLMCFIGRLDCQKGYDLLLEACIEVLEETEMQIVIVGAGRADLVEQTKALEKKFPSKFFYAGWMGPERYALLAGCDYTLLPSRWEPCGLVQMEAMRVGTLPIVAPTGGLKDTVEDGVNGLWTDAEMVVEAEIDEESCASIARALKRAAQIHSASPEKEAQMKRAAMAAAAEFTWSNAALQYEAVFEELGVPDLLPLSKERSVTLEVDKQVC